MHKRIIMWRLKDNTQDQSRKDNAQLLKGMLEQLPSKISGIEHLKVALNIAEAPDAADLVLISFYQDKQAYERFLKHPEYLKVIMFINNVSSDQRFVEYEG